ncbi:hypothetical protein H0H81_005674 [Sphagnurus paluster]|uniref:Uncharacterized protein n=1 Tax=Sphagnurus paluster TaxID=117069 RepID=A0A9P7K7S2_9AGAR|nr:hypothetical protein H0H81_005674 [Sphagnurus paluster]
MDLILYMKYPTSHIYAVPGFPSGRVYTIVCAIFRTIMDTLLVRHSLRDIMHGGGTVSLTKNTAIALLMFCPSALFQNATSDGIWELDSLGQSHSRHGQTLTQHSMVFAPIRTTHTQGEIEMDTFPEDTSYDKGKEIAHRFTRLSESAFDVETASA